MVRNIRRHRANNAELVDNFGHLRKNIADPGAILSVLLERKGRFVGGVTSDDRRPGLTALQHRFPRIEPQSAQRRSRVAGVALLRKQGANPLFEKLFPFIGVRGTDRLCTQQK